MALSAGVSEKQHQHQHQRNNRKSAALAAAAYQPGGVKAWRSAGGSYRRWRKSAAKRRVSVWRKASNNQLMQPASGNKA
jgi:hypothetical protein